MQSGDKPAAVHFVFLVKLELLSHAIETAKNLVKHSETRALCGLARMIGKWQAAHALAG